MSDLYNKLVFALLPILLDEEPIPYHDSMLTTKLRYEELMNTRNDNRFRDECRMDRNSFLRLLSKLQTEAGLADSTHICAGVKLMIYIGVLKGFSNRELGT